MEVRLNRIALLRPACDDENQNPGKDLGDCQQWARVGNRLTYWTVGGVVPDGNRIGVNRLARDMRGLPICSLFKLGCD